MDDRGLALLRRMMSDVEGAPFPAELDLERYAIWYEHAQQNAQEALEYLNDLDPDYGRVNELPDDFA